MKIDALETAQKISAKSDEIENLVDKLDQAAEDKSSSLADYEKAVAITILKLKNGAITEFEGNPINNIPATLIPPVARGICYKESFDKEMGETNYKSLTVKIDAKKAVLNGLQSVNKFLQ